MSSENQRFVLGVTLQSSWETIILYLQPLIVRFRGFSRHLKGFFFFLYNPNRPIQKSYSYYGAQEIFSDAQEILTDFQEILSDAQEILKWFFRDFLWGSSDL